MPRLVHFAAVLRPGWLSLPEDDTLVSAAMTPPELCCPVRNAPRSSPAASRAHTNFTAEPRHSTLLSIVEGT